MPTFNATLVQRTPQQLTGPLLVELGPLVGSLTYEDELNGDGQATVVAAVEGTLPNGNRHVMSDTMKSAIRESIENDDPPGLEVWVHRDSTRVWAGPVVALGLRPGEVTFTARGLGYYLRRLWVKYQSLTYTSTDQYTIAADLIDQWQDQDFGSYGIDTSGVGTSGVTRAASYLTAEHHNVFQRLGELADRASGFDWWITPATRAFNLAASKGSDKTATVILDSRNIEDSGASVSLSADDLASEAWAITDGPAVQQVASNTTLRTSYGRSGVTGSFQSISSTATLLDHAEALRNAAAVPMVNPEWTIFPQGVNPSNIDTGDLVECSFDWGFGEVTVQRRIVRKTTRVDATGNETVGVGLL